MRIFLLLLVLFPLSVSATQYRCNGRIQYRPCDKLVSVSRPARFKNGTAALAQAQANAAKASFRYQAEMKQGSKVYADIVKASYQRHPKSKNYGQWRGIVKGNGDIHLSLLIDQKGRPPENRYMGHVILKNDQTSFNFVSSPPKEGDWSWKILATPR